MSKNKLHDLVQKEYGSLPTYTFAKDGPDHAPQFRAFVSFCGLTFQSPQFCKTVRQAENAAADVALDALSAKPDDEPMQTNVPAVTVQIQSGEAHLNLQKEGNKEQTLQQPGIVPSTSESGITTALPTSQHKEQRAQIPQIHPQSFPNLNHVVPFREFSTSENSGRGTNKQSRGNINSVSANSGNETNKEQVHNIAAGMLGKRQRTEDIQQPEERVLTPQFLSGVLKTQLQDYAVKGGFDLPTYSCIREGPSHVPRFKATVKFNGQIFEGPGFCNTVRQAEHAAASVALKSLSERGSTLVESHMYKNVLQIKAQKEGRDLPVYITTMSGQAHAPIFTGTVKFNGMAFEGKDAKTKKQAENNAASVALSALKDLRGSAVSTVQVHDDKGKAPVCESSDHPLIQAINHLKEATTRAESNGELSHLDLSTSLSEVSLLEPLGDFKIESKKELLQNITTSLLGNRVEEKVQQACKTDSEKEFLQNITSVIGNRVKDKVQQACKTDSEKELVPNITSVIGNRIKDKVQQACKTDSDKELVQNMTSVLGNRVEDSVQQSCNSSSPTKFSSGTRIRIVPASKAFGTNPWVVMNLTASSMPSQNGAPEN